jgi:3-hydroxyisobutyrate dehydrogenase
MPIGAIGILPPEERRALLAWSAGPPAPERGVLLLHERVAERAAVPLEVSPLLLEIFKDGMARYGAREWSPNIVRRLEEATGLDISAPGFPTEMVDDEAEAPGSEVIPSGAERGVAAE